MPSAPSSVSSRPTRSSSFAVVVAIELWERFGYYGMQAVLLLFMVRQLGMADARANLLMGAFAAMAYALPVVGGWVGDRVLGSRRAMLLGATCMMGGYAALAVATVHVGLMTLAMALIATGNGFFKPNAANLVRRIYEGDDTALDSAFTLYYMAVNVGSTASILLTPVLQDHFGPAASFATCSGGLLFGLCVYTVLRSRLRHVGSAPDFLPLAAGPVACLLLGMAATITGLHLVLDRPSVARACVWLAALAVLAMWAVIYRRAAPAQRPGLRMAYMLSIQGMIYFVFYQQIATSLTLFALRAVRGDVTLGGFTLFHMSAGQFQALNPIWIMVASPILAFLYRRLARQGRDLPIARKFVLGYSLVTLAFVIWWLGALSGGTGLVSPWFMVAAYCALAVGELLVGGLGLAVIARYVPAAMGGFMMGSYLLAMGVAMYVGSMVANLAAGAPTHPAAGAQAYAGLFLTLAIAAGLIVVLFAALLPLARRWDRQHVAASVPF
ncbi:peptide MFS transporter [Gluconacetobacter takamatsuzukensis]|uniref:MFS transporter n=1 Tax=Gluconacetobacter takamatsuzukensis TaxID=1286190 RepID=A0A7W4KEK4_9PROT|nr:oligopeptide:H+ symporter [Gluconacetobacter takamatsuzukensis]MBB2205491.1 MFS transporter [Gluconacetobacter takamatsuzukensis]